MPLIHAARRRPYARHGNDDGQRQHVLQDSQKRAIIRYHFDSNAHRLSYMEAPPAIPGEGDQGTVLIPAAGGQLGFAGLSEINLRSLLVRLWETKVGAAKAAAAWEE